MVFIQKYVHSNKATLGPRVTDGTRTLWGPLICLVLIHPTALANYTGMWVAKPFNGRRTSQRGARSPAFMSDVTL